MTQSLNEDNLSRAEAVLEACARFGIREFCVGSGSRNGSLLAALCAAQGLKTNFFFDERSAAFFALGRARRRGEPVAVITTSGTAAAELLPAVIEAHYSGVPILIITADRPRRFEGTGAPQAIEQLGIYKGYTGFTWDFEGSELNHDTLAGALRTWRDSTERSRPAHLNLRFDEPVLDAPPRLREYRMPRHEPVGLSMPDAKPLKDFLAKSRRPLVVVSGLSSTSRLSVKKFLLRLGAPLFVEASSGLRSDRELMPLILRSSERVIAYGAFDSVLRLGSVPTLRFWRDLDERYTEIPVMSVDTGDFSGLPRGLKIRVPSLGQFFESIEVSRVSESFEALFEVDRARLDGRLELFARFPKSEPAMIHALSRRFPNGSRVYVGNSMPIREWDLASDYGDRSFEVLANRGANGIDGQLSTFFGLCDAQAPNWALLGDLTTLYDLNAPWVLPQLEEFDFSLFVIHNNGGQIFSRLGPLQRNLSQEFRDRAFVQRHNIGFRSWAEMWNLGFEEWDHIAPQLPAAKQGVVELRPDELSTAQFWENFAKLWQRAESS